MKVVLLGMCTGQSVVVRAKDGTMEVDLTGTGPKYAPATSAEPAKVELLTTAPRSLRERLVALLA